MVINIIASDCAKFESIRAELLQHYAAGVQRFVVGCTKDRVLSPPSVGSGPVTTAGKS